MLRISQNAIDELLAADWPLGDPTTEGLGISREKGRVTAFYKKGGIAAGTEIARRLFETAGADVTLFAKEGERLAAGAPILTAEGCAESLHAAYKVAQCVMEYAGGIAERTHQMLEAARRGREGVQVAGTRKHFPGGKLVSLSGFLAGGGILHRGSLSDSILVFDQHRCFADNVDAAIGALIAAEPERKVAVEVDSAEEALHYARLGVHVIQCERFTPQALRELTEALWAADLRVVVNAAGGVNAENAEEYARAGAHVLVTSWPYFGRPADVKMKFERRN